MSWLQEGDGSSHWGLGSGSLGWHNQQGLRSELVFCGDRFLYLTGFGSCIWWRSILVFYGLVSFAGIGSCILTGISSYIWTEILVLTGINSYIRHKSVLVIWQRSILVFYRDQFLYLDGDQFSSFTGISSYIWTEGDQFSFFTGINSCNLTDINYEDQLVFL